MNETEKKAFYWLISAKGYSCGDVLFQRCSSPDFICADGQKFEVKKLTQNKILFHRKQFEYFKSLTNLTILVYDETQQCNIPLFQFSFSSLLENSMLIQGCRLYVSPKKILSSLNCFTVPKTEYYELLITARTDERNRIQIPKDVAERANLKKNDLCSFVLTQIVRREE